MAEEIQNQTEDLPRLALEFKRNGRSIDASETIFTGSGDSYASALFAREISGWNARVEDPYELLNHPASTRGKGGVVISTSGRTVIKILVARKIASISGKTIVITAITAAAWWG